MATDNQPFFQDPPQLTNTFEADSALRFQLERLFAPEQLAEIRPQLHELGELAAGSLQTLAIEAERDVPELVQYEAWGRRVDKVRISPAWREIHRIGAEQGLMATAHEARLGWRSRLHQAALIHLFGPSSAFVSCPYAMTDGAIAILKRYADPELAARPLRHLLSRDPDQAWTSGQWMTEKEGGSDVSRSTTTARREAGVWRLYGNKFFVSAVTAECALTLANAQGTPGLSLFFVQPWNADGTLRHITLRKLKEKLGTRALPTAEIDLQGVEATLVGKPGDGVRLIATVLNLARFHNTLAATGIMARALQLAKDYAGRRVAFGRPLIEQPLHLETLAGLQVEYEAGLAIALRLAELIGKVETRAASPLEAGACRLLTPVAKLGTGKQVVRVASEAIEAIGGMGYIEETGLPRLLRDAQVLPLWEGTTNVLSLDALRAIDRQEALRPFLEDTLMRVAQVTTSELDGAVKSVRTAVQTLGRHTESMARGNRCDSEAAARRFALGLFNTYAAALLTEAANWEATRGQSCRLTIAARRWIGRGLTDLAVPDAQYREESRLLL
ncbi:acyl-CoA dehydrogenase family protein [Sedimenticola hydrogenitrophicus]|uniref:acyl-CoA dehydrogenase family protein n=1 Tax=Sedimenticola hydrogenitrophicus TaxID=2967975 RepID=UPI0021A40BB8|nr:acyl-CoA dehydrogenase family protein [Sedimenticola hydrogenitrophicus]